MSWDAITLIVTSLWCKISNELADPVMKENIYDDSAGKSRKVYRYHDRYDEYLSSPVWQAEVQNVIAQLERR